MAMIIMVPKKKFLLIVNGNIDDCHIYEAESPELAAAERMEDSGNGDETVEVFNIGKRLGVYGMPKTWVKRLE